MMLSRERFELQVGIVFVVALAFLIVGVMWAKRFRPGQAEMRIYVSFPTVAGLLKGDDVLVSGMRMGEVKDIQLRERDVLVTIALERKITLTETYRVRIIMLNFTGEMGVAIAPGNGKPLEEPLPELVGEQPLEISEIVEPGIAALRSIRSAADTLAAALPQIAARTTRTLDQLDRLLAGLDEGVATNRVALEQALEEFRRTARATRELADTMREQMEGSATHAEALLASVKATSDTLRQVLISLRRTQGTLGRLIQEPTLHEQIGRAAAHLDSAAVSLDSLVRDVQENPKRYLHFSIF